jgi:hypothetical protein
VDVPRVVDEGLISVAPPEWFGQRTWRCLLYIAGDAAGVRFTLGMRKLLVGFTQTRGGGKAPFGNSRFQSTRMRRKRSE